MTTTKAKLTIDRAVAKIQHPDFIAGYGYNTDGNLIFYSKINGQPIEQIDAKDLDIANPYDLPGGLLAGIAAIIPDLTFIKNK